MLTSGRPRLDPRAESGMTLIETLVAIVAGMVVLGAAFAILEVGLHQSSRLVDVNSATQSGRIALTRVVDELHSSCVFNKLAPVKAGSSESKLILVNGYSEKANLPAPATKAEGVHKDEIEWSETPAGNKFKAGNLKDTTYLATSEANGEGEYTWSGEASPKGGQVIGERIRSSETEGSPPFFRYYAYGTKATAGSSETLSTLNEIKLSGTSLSAAQAKTVAAVGVAFRALPPDEKTTVTSTVKSTGVDLESLVTLTFSAPNSEATIKAGPCE